MPTDTSRASLDLLYHISRDLASALDLKTVLQRVLLVSLTNVGAERGAIIVLDDRSEPLDAAIVYGNRVQPAQQLRDTLEKGLAGWVAQNRKAVLVPNTSKEPRWLRRPDDAIERSGAKSAICVPLLARERLVGVLTVVHPVPGKFGPDHMALMQAIADQAGIAMLNARLYAESQRQARVMAALAESAIAMNASLRQQEVLQKILDQTAQALRVEVVLLGLIDGVGQQIEYRAVTGGHVEGIRGLRRPLGKGAVGSVAQTGRGLVVSDPQKLEGEQLPGLEVKGLVCAPVHAKGKIIGVLQAVNPLSGSMEPDSLLVLSGIGSLAGTAIHNAQLYEQLQSAHQRYRELFDDSIDSIILTDMKGKILEANRQAGKASGYEPKTLAGLGIDVIHALNSEKVGARFEKITSRGTISYESQLKLKNGSTIPVQMYVRRVTVQSGECLQWIIRDISERKERDSMREDLMAMIYHDLRSPLANVVSSIDVLSQMMPASSAPQAQSVLKIATRSTERIQRLVNSLLDVYSLEAGQTLAERSNVEPHVLIDEAVEVVRTMMEGREQTLVKEISAGLPRVWIDMDMMRRVLINLLENASKFSAPGTQICIGAERSADKVTFWVKDSGPGIPPESREQIFVKFTRLHQENAPRGLGLGLAFSRLAVQAHGGRIWVDSTLGEGSKFQFTLPVTIFPAEK